MLRPRRLIRTRIQQGDVAILALEIAASRPGGHITTTDLKAFMGAKFKPTAGDAVPNARGHVALFDQIIGNLISNRREPQSMFALRYATYSGTGIQITQAGRDFLQTVPR